MNTALAVFAAMPAAIQRTHGQAALDNDQQLATLEELRLVALDIGTDRIEDL